MSGHVPVLLREVLELLDPKPGKVFIDCTLGLGGHSKALLQAMHGKGAVYGMDSDDRNLELAKENLKEFTNVHCTRDNFENLEAQSAEILAKDAQIDGILFDLGLSSFHVDEPERGFSFQRSGPLDMRYDTRQPVTAAEIVNTWTAEQLSFIFKNYGEERYAHRIAKEIVEHRRKHRFATTSELADLLERIFTPPWALKSGKKFYFKRHPATRVFQALRIAANREIEALTEGLKGAVQSVSLGGRIAVISYHSLEDRIVKYFFREKAKEGVLKILTKKPVVPKEEELKSNPRSRSAKLRVAEKM